MSNTLDVVPALQPALQEGAAEQVTPQEIQAATQAASNLPASETTVPTGVNTQAVQQVNSTTGQATAAPQDDTTPDAALSSFDNIPVYQMTPNQAFSAWGEQTPTQQIYVGSGSKTSMGHNQVIGALADKFGISQKKQKSESEKTLEQQVLEHAAKVTGFQGAETLPLPGMPGKHTSTPLSGEEVEPLAGGKHTSTPKAKGTTEGATWSLLAQTMGIAIQPNEDPAAAVARRIGVNTEVTGQPQTKQTSQIIAGIRSTFNGDQLKALQQQLLEGGMFNADAVPGSADPYTPGNWDVQTQQAIGNLMTLTGQMNKSGQNLTWNDALNFEVNQMNQLGGWSAVMAKEPKTSVKEATEGQMLQPAISAFEAKLGRAPTAAELKGMTTQYDVMQGNAAATAVPGSPAFYADANGIPTVPGIPTPSQEAANYSMQNDATEYQGHQMANAYALFLNAISNRPLGSDPNLTSAARPIGTVG